MRCARRIFHYRCSHNSRSVDAQKKAAEKKESEKAAAVVVQVDDLLSFRQFSKKAVDDVIDVSICGSSAVRCAHGLVFARTPRTLIVRQARERSQRTSSQILAGFRSSPGSPMQSTRRRTSKFMASIFSLVSSSSVRESC